MIWILLLILAALAAAAFVGGRTLAISNLEKVLFPEVGFTKAQVIDYYVRIDTNDYSVDPRAIGRIVDVTADLDRVRVRLDGRIIADHTRVWARGMVITDPAHREAAAVLRREFQQPRLVPVGDDLTRDLADYDRAFGLVEGSN